MTANGPRTSPPRTRPTSTLRLPPVSPRSALSTSSTQHSGCKPSARRPRPSPASPRAGARSPRPRHALAPGPRGIGGDGIVPSRRTSDGSPPLTCPRCARIAAPRAHPSSIRGIQHSGHPPHRLALPLDGQRDAHRLTAVSTLRRRAQLIALRRAAFARSPAWVLSPTLSTLLAGLPGSLLFVLGVAWSRGHPSPPRPRVH